MDYSLPDSRPTEAEVDSEDGLLSIGGLADATGISPDTLRMWERRYGRPTPVRLPSGHRRYTSDQVRWLRRVAEAIARGHRPGRVVRAGERELEAMLGDPFAGDSLAPEIASLCERVALNDEIGLLSRLRADWRALGPLDFLESRLGPFLVAIGRAWADGRIDVRHEHLASEAITDFLRTARAELSRPERAPVIVLATLKGEMHGLGLQMAALLASLSGVEPRVLGVDTPLEEIAGAARELGAHAVGISVSLSSGGVDTDRQLAELLSLLPEGTRLLVGGEGARGVRRGPRGVEYAEDLASFDLWLRRFAEEHRSRGARGGS